MAAENIGSLYPTKVPGYSDAADIQAALRMYHYGDPQYNIQNTDPGNLQPDSVAGSFNALDVRVTSLEDAEVPIAVTATEPTSPTNGFMWVDTEGSGISGGAYGTIIDYVSSAPSSYLYHGRLWAKLGSSPIELYIYNGNTTSWNRLI